MANQPTSPPPGSVPGSFSPGDMDMSELMQQAGGQLPGGKSGPGAASSGNAKQPPRPIAGPQQEAAYLAQGVGQGLLELLPDYMQHILGIKDSDSPEEKAKKKQMFENYQRLSAEDQAYVQKKMQREQMEKQQREQEEEQKRQQEMANQSNDLPIPAGRTSGAGSEGNSNKQRTTNKLQDDRKKMSSAG